MCHRSPVLFTFFTFVDNVENVNGIINALFIHVLHFTRLKFAFLISSILTESFNRSLINRTIVYDLSTHCIHIERIHLLFFSLDRLTPSN